MDEDDIIKVAILKKHAIFFARFAKKMGFPIYRVENEMISLAKEAMKSPVLTEVVKGAVKIYTNEKDEEEDIIIDIPPKNKKGGGDAEEEE